MKLEHLAMTVGDHEIRFDALKELEVSMTGPSRD